jgi:hypothetical protein
MNATEISKQKYMVADEQPDKKPKAKGFEKKKDAEAYYMDLLDAGKNKTGQVTLYYKKGKEWRWLWESTPTSISGRKTRK